MENNASDLENRSNRNVLDNDKPNKGIGPKSMGRYNTSNGFDL
jgi:hypothetical protein